jgi:hypothetical protein
MINYNKLIVFRQTEITSHPIGKKFFYLFTRGSNLSCLLSLPSEGHLAGHPCYITIANDTVVQ